jgi:hypothetical protein
MMDPHPIPLIYRITFNFFEPFMAFAGAMQAHFDAPTYLSIANPNIAYHPSLQPLLTSILGGWLIMVFNDAITLRVFSRDAKVWRCILSAHLLSDLAYALAVCQDLGVARFFNPLLWNAMDWLLIGTTIPPMVLKVTFILGLGVDFSDAGRHRGKKER